MVKITYVDTSGAAHEIDAVLGHSVMETAVKNDVPGIAAECGGAIACGTCRVYVDDAWRSSTGEVTEAELEMLEFSDETNPAARLSCQITVTEELDGLVVRIPAY